MDRYKELERKLRNHKLEISYLEYLKKQLELLEEERHLRGQSSEQGNVQSNTISDITADTAIKIVEKEKELKLKINKKQIEIEHIERLLYNLSEMEREVITRHYMHNMTYNQISLALHCSYATVKRERKKGFDRILYYFK